MDRSEKRVVMLLQITAEEKHDKIQYIVQRFECEASDTEYKNGVWKPEKLLFRCVEDAKWWIEHERRRFVQVSDTIYVFRHVHFEWPKWQDGENFIIRYLWDSTRVMLTIGKHVTIPYEDFCEAFSYSKFCSERRK